MMNFSLDFLFIPDCFCLNFPPEPELVFVPERKEKSVEEENFADVSIFSFISLPVVPCS